MNDNIIKLPNGLYKVFCANSRKAQILNRLFNIFPDNNLAREGSELIWIFDESKLVAVTNVMNS